MRCMSKARVYNKRADIRTHLVKGLFPYLCAALLTNQVRLRVTMVRNRNATMKDTNGSSPHSRYGTAEGIPIDNSVYRVL